MIYVDVWLELVLWDNGSSLVLTFLAIFNFLLGCVEVFLHIFDFSSLFFNFESNTILYDDWLICDCNWCGVIRQGPA